MAKKYSDYSIKMQDGAGREAVLSINGASIGEMIADGYSLEEAHESLESNQFQKAIADGRIGADARAVNLEEAHGSLVQAKSINLGKVSEGKTAAVVYPNADSNDQHVIYTVRTAQDFADLHLSFYTLSCLARATSYVYPHLALPAAIKSGLYDGKLTLDRLGNFVSFL